MDLVYILKPAEKNEDLKYSLRSVAKFVPHDNIWIVGYKPAWVTNVHFIPTVQRENKWKNSVNNIIAACRCDQISEDFVLMNDDFFAIRPIDNLEESINLSLGSLDEAVQKYKDKGSRWGKAFLYIDELLKALNIEGPYYNYEAHTPLIINRKKYLDIMNLPLVQDFMQTEKVLHKRSLYKNIEKINARVLPTDVKISPERDNTKEKVESTKCDWISVYDGQVGDLTKFRFLNNFLMTLFGAKCKYEL